MMSSPYFMALLFCLVGLPWLRSGELWQPLDEGGLCATGPLSTITQSMDLLYTSTKSNNPWTVIYYLQIQTKFCSDLKYISTATERSLYPQRQTQIRDGIIIHVQNIVYPQKCYKNPQYIMQSINFSEMWLDQNISN